MTFRTETSLSGKLLRRLLPAMLLMVVVSAIIAYLIAHQAATRAYDRSLIDSARAIANQVNYQDGNLTLRLPPVAEQMLLTDEFDTEYFQVVDANGKSIAGHRDLPRPEQLSPINPLAYDAMHNGQPVRVVALRAEKIGSPFMVIAAETIIKRQRMVSEILLAMLVPEMLLIMACAILVHLGIQNGLSGIGEIREQLARRSHADLRPLTLSDVPLELQPLLAETNRLLQRLEISTRAQHHLVANASHQLRTPIAALQGEAELALRSADPRGGLERVVASTRRVAHLAHQLLTLSRLDPGHLPQPRRVDLHLLLREAASRWMPMAISRNSDLGFELAPATVIGEAVWIEELATNLVDNALRYTPLGSIVTVRCGMRLGAAWLEVEDNGPGIPATEREHVFERFYRLQDSDAEGSGLGLSIVREAARTHGANVVIGDGANACGTLVRVKFPPPQPALASSSPSS